MKKSKIVAVALALALCLGMLTACGNKNDNTEEAKDPTKLSESVSVVAYEGAGTDVLKNIKGDYNVKGYNKLKDVEKKIKTGDYDVAVLPTTSADKMYGETKGGLVEISPTDQNGLFLLSNNYYLSNDSLSGLAGKTIYVTGENSTAVRVLKYLLNTTSLGTGQYTVKVLDSYEEIEKALGDYGNIALVSQPYVSSIMKSNSSVSKMVDLNEKWKDETNTDIPTDVVIASKDFAENRSDDLKVFINDYQSALDNTKSSSKLIFYSASNRGTSLLKAFNKTMYEYNSEIFDGRDISGSLYYQK